MDHTRRFDRRAEEYATYRPGYPSDIVDYLQREFGLTTDKRIADIGAGTGISTELFLRAGYQTVAIEPNMEMLGKAKKLLSGFPGFEQAQGSAEATSLKTDSVDAVVAGQAFHWFDPPKFKAECKRILRKNGLVILIWNERNTRSVFEMEYDALIVQHARDYLKVKHRGISLEEISAFFAPGEVSVKIFSNEQVFDFSGLQGRLSSSSYMPLSDEAGYPEMIADLRKLFDRRQENGAIKISYDARLYTGRLV